MTHDPSRIRLRQPKPSFLVNGPHGVAFDHFIVHLIDKADPSIENYVRLRRGDPEAEIEIGIVGGFELMFYMREELAQYGIDPELLGGILDADQDAISEMALRLMEKLIEAQAIAADGETHLIRRGLAIPEKLIDWIICCSLDGLSWNDDLYDPT